MSAPYTSSATAISTTSRRFSSENRMRADSISARPGCAACRSRWTTTRSFGSSPASTSRSAPGGAPGTGTSAERAPTRTERVSNVSGPVFTNTRDSPPLSTTAASGTVSACRVPPDATEAVTARPGISPAPGLSRASVSSTVPAAGSASSPGSRTVAAKTSPASVSIVASAPTSTRPASATGARACTQSPPPPTIRYRTLPGATTSPGRASIAAIRPVIGATRVVVDDEPESDRVAIRACSTSARATSTACSRSSRSLPDRTSPRALACCWSRSASARVLRACARRTRAEVRASTTLDRLAPPRLSAMVARVVPASTRVPGASTSASGTDSTPVTGAWIPALPPGGATVVPRARIRSANGRTAARAVRTSRRNWVSRGSRSPPVASVGAAGGPWSSPPWAETRSPTASPIRARPTGSARRYRRDRAHPASAPPRTPTPTAPATVPQPKPPTSASGAAIPNGG